MSGDDSTPLIGVGELVSTSSPRPPLSAARTAFLRKRFIVFGYSVFDLLKLCKQSIGNRISQSGRRRRAVALASVRRSNCTCRFPAYSFHEDAREWEGEPSEGIREMRFTKPNSSYSFTLGNCIQPRVRHRRKRCDQMRRTI